MKKLIMAFVVAVIATASQAAMVKWNGSINGIDPASLGDNGNYAANGAGVAGMSYVLTILSDDGSTTIATKSGTVASSTASVTFSDAKILKSTDYMYEIVLSGAPASLTGKVSDDYDYSNASMTTTLTGSISTLAMGTTGFDASPTSWTVSGIVPKSTPTPVPEPTSGLLLLLGVAGLALKRKNA